MKTLSNLVLYSVILFAFIGSALQANEAFGYKLTTDIVYGEGKITKDGVVTQRKLLLDVYEPYVQTKNHLAPAVILVHGGAFHRGGRRLPPYREEGAVHSRMEDYARMLAPLGYVCFVVEYRLAPELPEPDMKPNEPNVIPLDKYVTPSGLARTNFARKAMGLPILSEDEKIIIWNAAMSAAEDVYKVVEFVHKNAQTYNIDTKKIAVGGHSAGAATTLNVTYGLKAPVAAIFPMSPPDMLFELDKVVNSSDLPPALVVIGQYDIPVIQESIPPIVSQMKSAGVKYELAWVPGFPHFYPSGAVSLGDDATRTSLGERIIDFLDKHLKK